MAKFRMAGKKKAAPKRPPGAIPCIILIVLGIVLVSLLLYVIMRSGA